MKPFILFLTILSLLFLGCAGIEYNAQTETFKYWRLGNQEIAGLRVDKDGEKLEVAMDEQKSANKEIAEILKIVRKLLEVIP